MVSALAPSHNSAYYCAADHIVATDGIVSLKPTIGVRLAISATAQQTRAMV